ncbi:sirohydrochlorin cobaltochelatase [Parasporobacterium paucivorans]|uniref:Anaerobic cobaltochelatase n=1 Tax=Parasporobacterium paucivorans DSM 15970 TaxID=1122934 RepID=A0A1M6DRU4_9FIRM|nr:sirohydrochlorin cobaltochelatase [Parasporobacterium paucivorans]SHI75839.1 anaerobic cobaltochelatase [Parasporobacterium paucivorans DSM 15970]
MKNTMSKNAILIVSFGTSFNETREKNIDSIEKEIMDLYPGYSIYSAWTSKMIIKKVMQRDGRIINTVSEAMEQIVRDGIEELTVQPTHIINGLENDFMIADVMEHSKSLRKISIGAPLLNNIEDARVIIEVLTEEYSMSDKRKALVLMGHGSSHHSNFAYAALDYSFKESGHENVFVGTIEAYPGIDVILRSVNAYNPSEIILIPFMLVAGDHAANDMAGDEEDSWKYIFESAGYPVKCFIKGLGEYTKIRDLYFKHLEAALIS